MKKLLFFILFTTSISTFCAQNTQGSFLVANRSDSRYVQRSDQQIQEPLIIPRSNFAHMPPSIPYTQNGPAGLVAVKIN